MSDTMASQVVIGMDPHKRSVTIEVMADDHHGGHRALFAGLFKRRVGTPDVRHKPIPAASVLLEGLDDEWAMVSADGTAYRELHARTHRHAPPALSPDGRRIAWWEERGRDNSVMRTTISQPGRGVVARGFTILQRHGNLLADVSYSGDVYDLADLKRLATTLGRRLRTTTSSRRGKGSGKDRGRRRS